MRSSAAALLPVLFAHVSVRARELAVEHFASVQSSKDEIVDNVLENLFDWTFQTWPLRHAGWALLGGSPSDLLSPMKVSSFTPSLLRRRGISIAHSQVAAKILPNEVGPMEGRAGSNSPPVLLDDVCLVPGDPMVRIEDAPNNAVRIFTGIDMVAPLQSVWDVLTDYENLHKVVPSLVSNRVLERYSSGGARIAQVGAAAVLPGLEFKASMVLDVNLYLEDKPLPESQIADHLERGASSSAVRDFDSKLPLRRGIFPRPYAGTSLPHRDITMANVVGSQGDFEHYQGVWRIQALPGCAPKGAEATRLTYAVEIKPKGFLPVKLIDRRIASDLKMNLMAIRKHVEA